MKSQDRSEQAIRDREEEWRGLWEEKEFAFMAWVVVSPFFKRVQCSQPWPRTKSQKELGYPSHARNRIAKKGGSGRYRIGLARNGGECYRSKSSFTAASIMQDGFIAAPGHLKDEWKKV